MSNLHSSIGHNFLAGGTTAIETTHAIERRLAEAETHRVHALAHETGFRHAIGTTLISLGAFIAGTTTQIQDRQATMPAPAPGPGLVPTR